jgi:superfamily I DNA/RNA helicase
VGVNRHPADLPDAAVREQVAQFQAGRARLIGGPGTGKSTLLGERVRALAEAGFPASSIVFLTFTRRAVSSLQADLAALADPPSVFTLHSFCLAQLRRSSGDAYVGLDVLDDVTEDCLFRPLACAALGMSKGGLNDKILEFEDAWYHPDKPEPAGMEAFEAFLEWIKRAFNVALRAELVVRYREQLKEGGTPPPIAHLIVDEYQDLNQAECEVVDIISGSASSLIVAGDDDQALYEFKGARPDLLRNFVDAHAPCADFVLSACMRYGPAIGEPLAALMEHDHGDRIPKHMQFAATLPCVGPEAFPTRSPEEQIERLIATLNGWRTEAEEAARVEGDEFRQRRALVLMCWKGAAAEMLEALREADLVPAAGAKENEMEPCVLMALQALCRSLATAPEGRMRPLDVWAWVQTWPGVGPRAILRLMEHAAQQRRGGRVLLRDGDGSPSGAMRAAVTALRSMVEHAPRTCAELVGELRGAGIPDAYRVKLLDALAAACASLPGDEGLDEVAAALSRAPRIVSDDPLPDGSASTRPLIVEVMTLHASKGLTADYAVVVDAFREVLPANKSRDRGRRLAYVAMSRARRALVLIYPTSVFRGPRKRAGVGAALDTPSRRPTPYIAEAGVVRR